MSRIGIDATAIPPTRAGAGNYIYHLVEAAAEIDDHDFVVFANAENIRSWKAGERSGRMAYVPVTTTPRLRRLLWEQCRLPALLRKHRVDVLLSPHYTMPLGSRVPGVVTFHDMTYFLQPEVHQRVNAMFFQWMMRRTSRRAQGLVADSLSTANDMVHVLGVDPARITVVHLACAPRYRPIIDPDQLVRTCGRYGLVPNQYLLYVGVLEPRKNLPAVVEAFVRTCRERPAQRLALVGRPGWAYDHVYRVIEQSGVSDRIVLTGYVPDEQLPALYSGASVFVYPSLYEGFGLPVLEALGCGAPVVTSSVSSLPEICGDAALTVSPTDIDALADAIERLLSDRALRESLKAAGPNRASAFSWRRTAEETFAVCGRVARGGSCREGR